MNFCFLLDWTEYDCIQNSPTTLGLTGNPEMFKPYSYQLNMETENHSTYVSITSEIYNSLHTEKYIPVILNGIQLQQKLFLHLGNIRNSG